MFGPKTQSLQQRAQKVLPLGVNSNFRFWGNGITPYVEKGKGAYLWDVDGKKYIDYRMAFGPIILGHSCDEVDQIVIEEIHKGVLFAMTGELEVAVAEMIVEMCPGVEMVRFACSGTEATMHAIRVARAYTGRDLIVKFEGNYHGMHDHALWSTYAPVDAYGNRRSPIAVPASSGIPKSMREFIITLPFNDFEGFERVMRSYGEQIAAVITEPCQGNCAAINPQDGFLELIRRRTEEHGCVFILDEVKTGFRIANGGAQEYYGIKPDLATYAKALGNGYPAAAFGGKKEIMSIIGQGVAQGGTYTNNKPGVAAAFATLSLLKSKPILKTIEKRGQRLMDGLKEIFEENDMQAVFTGYPAMFSFSFGIDAITCQRDWAKSDHDLYRRMERLGDRVFTDIDFAAYGKHRNSFVPFFESHGYELEKRAAMISGGTRFIFFSARIPMIDLFFDKLDYNHPIDYRGRLEHHPYCVSMADLMLQKLQIVQINDKDLKDAMLLLLAGQVGDSDSGMINTKYIAKIMSEDWGFYYTATLNLHKVKDATAGVVALTEQDRAIICEKADLILKSIEDAPKSFGWKMRAKTGTKKIWYQEVSDWA